jgi:hypothetical protein
MNSIKDQGTKIIVEEAPKVQYGEVQLRSKITGSNFKNSVSGRFASENLSIQNLEKTT